MTEIYSDWTVKFENIDNGKIAEDKFSASRKSEVIHAFKECYRHGNYKVLEVTEGEPYKE